MAGQILRALDSGQYDAHSCGVLIGQAGDECRGSCFIRILRRVLDRAGYPEVALVSLNVRGIDRQDALPLNPGMIGKALAAAVWGDTLAIAGTSYALWRPVPALCRLSGSSGWTPWIRIWSALPPIGRSWPGAGRSPHLSGQWKPQNALSRMWLWWGKSIPKTAALGNWNLQGLFLAANGCRVHVGG